MVTRPRTARWVRDQPSVYTERPQSWVYGPETLINAMSLKDSLGHYSQRAERSVAGNTAWGAPGLSSRGGGEAGKQAWPRGAENPGRERSPEPAGFPSGGVRGSAPPGAAVPSRSPRRPASPAPQTSRVPAGRGRADPPCPPTSAAPGTCSAATTSRVTWWP